MEYFIEWLVAHLFGAGQFNGKIPVTPGNGITQGSGIAMNSKYTRLRFSSVQEAGFRSNRFNKIDTITLRAISEQAIPGCQVLVAWKGSIIYQKSFGNFLYSDSLGKVENTDC